MSEAIDPTVQALHDEISSVQKDLGAQVHQVKSEVGQMRAEMRSEMAELRKEMREVMACIGQLMEKSAAVRLLPPPRHATHATRHDASQTPAPESSTKSVGERAARLGVRPTTAVPALRRLCATRGCSPACVFPLCRIALGARSAPALNSLPVHLLLLERPVLGRVGAWLGPGLRGKPPCDCGDAAAHQRPLAHNMTVRAATLLQDGA